MKTEREKVMTRLSNKYRQLLADLERGTAEYVTVENVYLKEGILRGKTNGVRVEKKLYDQYWRVHDGKDSCIRYV